LYIVNDLIHRKDEKVTKENNYSPLRKSLKYEKTKSGGGGGIKIKSLRPLLYPLLPMEQQ